MKSGVADSGDGWGTPDFTGRPTNLGGLPMKSGVADSGDGWGTPDFTGRPTNLGGLPTKSGPGPAGISSDGRICPGGGKVVDQVGRICARGDGGDVVPACG